MLPPYSCIQTCHFTLDVQAFVVRIEDKHATIRMRDLRAVHLAIQFSFQESHFSLPMMTARKLNLSVQQSSDLCGGVMDFTLEHRISRLHLPACGLDRVKL
jgi:hypothetical protein